MTGLLARCLTHSLARCRSTLSAPPATVPATLLPLARHSTTDTACLTAGTSFHLDKQYTQKEVNQFVRSTGDANPIHVDAAAAKQYGLSAPLLPGMLLASLFPAIIGTHFPGALYATQTLAFRSPAAVGEALRAEVTVTKRSGSRVTFQTTCATGDGRLLVDGTAMAIIKGHDR